MVGRLERGEGAKSEDEASGKSEEEGRKRETERWGGKRTSSWNGRVTCPRNHRERERERKEKRIGERDITRRTLQILLRQVALVDPEFDRQIQRVLTLR